MFLDVNSRVTDYYLKETLPNNHSASPV